MKKRGPTGLFIRNARQRLGLNQSEFAEIMGLQQTYISNYETGRSMPPASLLMRIIKIFRDKGICPFCDQEDPWQK